ncbi:hypothetical protein ACFL58_01315 [Elusimicrobiota bacterium]
MRYKIAVLSVCFLMFGCTTGYHQYKSKDGFSEKTINKNTFSIKFVGNVYTSLEKVEDFALLRSAEIASKNGFNYFSVTDKKIFEDTKSYVTMSGATAYNGGYRPGGSVDSNFFGRQRHKFKRPTAEKTIKCFVNKPQKSNLKIYKAEEVIKTISAKYKLGRISQ